MKLTLLKVQTLLCLAMSFRANGMGTKGCREFNRFKESLGSSCDNSCDETSCASKLSSACSEYINQEIVMVTTTVCSTPPPVVITPSCVPVTVTDTHYHTSPAVTITPSCITVTVTNIHTKSYAPPVITIPPSCPVYPPPTSAKCPTVTFPQPPVLPTCTTTNTSAATAAIIDGVDSTGLAVLGSFTVLLALLLVVTITGWIYTALVRGKKNTAANISKENDAVIGLHNPVYGIEGDTLRPSEDQSVVQYSTQGPAYETIDIDDHNGYDVIDRRVPHPQPVSHTHNNKSVDQDYSVLDSEDMDHDYHVLEDTGGGLVSGGEVQDYEVPLTRRK